MDKLKSICCFLIAFLIAGFGAFAQIGTTTNSTNSNYAPTPEIAGLGNQFTIANLEAELKINSQNENAWLQLFELKRLSYFSEHSRSLDPKQKKSLDEMVKKMENNIPGSFASEYCKYLNGNKSNASIEHLRKASQLNPSYPEMQDELLFLSVLENSGKQKEYAIALANASKYNVSEIEYNRNVLNSIEANGVLITYGNVDTYPILIEQWKNGFRTDVKVICIEWLGNENYTAQTEQYLALKSGSLTGSEMDKFGKLLSAAKNKSIYAGLTLPPSFLKAKSEQLYCTGLAFKYSEVQLANNSSLVYNWENLFQKNQLFSGAEINKNYLVPLVLITKAYEARNQSEQASQAKQFLMNIASQHNLNKTVNQYID
jgi:hypothetical protein